jgi:fucose permease
MPSETPIEEISLLEHVANGEGPDAAARQGSRKILRAGAAMYSFAIIGMFQSSVGVMLHSISQHYSLRTIEVSLVFVAGPVGYVVAAQSSDFVHRRWGQRGIAVLGPALHILGALAIAAHPPYAIVLMAFAVGSLGIGFLDGAWCAWAATMENANAVSGILHGSFSLGATAGPVLAGVVLHTLELPWYAWYHFLVSAAEDSGGGWLIKSW